MHNLYAIVGVAASVFIAGSLVILLEWLERQQPFRHRFPFRQWILPLMLVLVAFLDGFLRHEFTLPGPSFAVLGALTAFVLIYGLYRGTAWLSSFEALAVWSTWSFGWTAAHGGIDDELLSSSFRTVGGISVVVTGLLVAWWKHEFGRERKL